MAEPSADQCSTCGRSAEEMERFNERGLCKVCSLVDRVEQSVENLTREVNKHHPKRSSTN